MKFFRFFKNEQEKEQEQEQKQENIEVRDETNKDETDFKDTMFYDIAEMKLKLENIKSETEIYEYLKSLINDFEKYIEKSSELLEEKIIEDKLNRIKESNIILEIKPNPEIPQLTIDKVNQELTIEDYYKNIKKVYEVKYKTAIQKILMRKIENFNKDLDLIELHSEINSTDIEAYKADFEILGQKKTEFTGIMQNRYIENLIEIEYKISMLETLVTGDLDTFIEKSQKNKAKQLIWSRLFIEDVEDFINKSDDTYSQEVKNKLERGKLTGEKDKIITTPILCDYINGIKNRIKDKIEQETKKELEEKSKQYKNITEEEINRNIKKLDDENFDTVTSYKNIIEYQIDIAMAKGIINDRNLLKMKDGFWRWRIGREYIPVALEKIKDTPCNYEVYTDVDNSNENVYIILSKKIVDYILTVEETYSHSQFNMYKINSTKSFSWFFLRYYKGEYDIRIDNSYGIRNYNPEYTMNYIKRLIKTYKENNEKNIEKIKFYIEIPYRRTIIPIIEELNSKDLEFTIPPIYNDDETKMNEPVIRIYMDRNDLNKYKEEVHNKISTPEKGIIKIGEEKLNLTELLTRGCNFDFLEEKEEKKER